MRRSCHDSVGIGHCVVGLLMIWVQSCERERVHSLVILQEECKVEERQRMCLRERLETSRYVSWKQCCPETLTEQGHVNWSLMGQRPFSIYYLMLKNACDRTPDGVQMKRICLDLFLQWIPQAAFKLRKAQVHYNTPLSHLWMETAQSYR